MIELPTLAVEPRKETKPTRSIVKKKISSQSSEGQKPSTAPDIKERSPFEIPGAGRSSALSPSHQGSSLVLFTAAAASWTQRQSPYIVFSSPPMVTVVLVWQPALQGEKKRVTPSMEQVGENSEAEQEQGEERPDTWSGGHAMKPNRIRARVAMIPCTTCQHDSAHKAGLTLHCLYRPACQHPRPEPKPCNEQPAQQHA